MYVFKHKRDKDLIDNVINGYGFIPGLLLSLILPINTPLAILFIGGIFASIVGKMIYGGFGNNIFNPALVGAIFVLSSFSTIISTNGGYLNNYELNTIKSIDPATNLTLVEGLGTYDTLVKPYGNLFDFFIGFIPGSIGEVSNLLILISFIYLVVTKTIKWKIPVTYISTVLIMTTLISLFTNIGLWYPLFILFSSGVLFGSVFMATDPVTSPNTSKGQIIYGILLGIITILLLYFTNYSNVTITSILLMNIFVPLIERITSKWNFNVLPYYITLGILIISIGSISYYITTLYTDDVVSDADFNIISKNVVDNKTIYEVTQKGFGGDIKALITFDSRKIISINIEDEKESTDRYKLIVDSDYINTLVEQQANIDNVDTVSSATITSNAIKKMVINVINDFKNNKSSINTTDDTNSYSGVLELKVIMKGSTIRTVVPVSFNDTCITRDKASIYYTCPMYMDEGYIDSVIAKQNDIDSVDTISGATISSASIHNYIIYVKGSSLNG